LFEIVILRRKLEKGIDLSIFESSSEILDDILNIQRSSHNKVVLGYDHKETNKGLVSGIQKNDKNIKTYAYSLQSSFKREKN
jgi:hypothetical protein